MAAARSETERELTAYQLDAFHKTFNFCMQCRQYTCAELLERGRGALPDLRAAPRPRGPARPVPGSARATAVVADDPTAGGAILVNGRNGATARTATAELAAGRERADRPRSRPTAEAPEAEAAEIDVAARLAALDRRPRAGTPRRGLAGRAPRSQSGRRGRGCGRGRARDGRRGRGRRRARGRCRAPRLRSWPSREPTVAELRAERSAVEPAVAAEVAMAVAAEPESLPRPSPSPWPRS